ncbi:pyrroline-5-carboxylate reductase, partial [Lactiplantibacillus plantarum]
MSKDAATKIAAQATLGSAQNVLASDKIPFDLIDQVSSPGGTTVAGLLAMEEAGFMTAVVKGIDATIA